jgi:predicted acylesterase/phospholipase RssA
MHIKVILFHLLLLLLMYYKYPQQAMFVDAALSTPPTIPTTDSPVLPPPSPLQFDDSLLTPPLPDLPLKNLVFEGGSGAQSVSFIGALKALQTTQYYDGDRKRFNFVNLGGSSYGCLFAYMTALQINADDMEEMVYKDEFFTHFLPMHLLNFADIHGASADNWLFDISNKYHMFSRVNDITKLWQMYNSPGFIDFAYILKHIERIIFKYTPFKDVITAATTFSELHSLTGHWLSCEGTRLPDRSGVIFSVDTMPHIPILYGVYMSMTLPGLFKPLLDTHNRVIIDGSLAVPLGYSAWRSDSETAAVPANTLAFSLDIGDYHTKSFANLNDEYCDYYSGFDAAANSPDADNLASPDVMDKFCLHYSQYDFQDFFGDLMSVMQYPRDYPISKQIVYLASPIKPYTESLSSADIGAAITTAYKKTLSSALFSTTPPKPRTSQSTDPDSFLYIDDDYDDYLDDNVYGSYRVDGDVYNRMRLAADTDDDSDHDISVQHDMSNDIYEYRIGSGDNILSNDIPNIILKH